MNLKKAISYIAFGFLFISLNINITINNLSTFNLLPDFVGWILFALAYAKMKKYASDNLALLWIPVVMALYSAVEWASAFRGAELLPGWLGLIFSILRLVYLFTLFGRLEMLAEDYAPHMTSMIHTLKILQLAFQIGQTALIVLAMLQMSDLFALLAMIALIAGVILTIVSCVTLFQLRSAVTEQLAGQPQDPEEFPEP